MLAVKDLINTLQRLRPLLQMQALYLWHRHDINGRPLPVELIDRQAGDKPACYNNKLFSANRPNPGRNHAFPRMSASQYEPSYKT